jgi:hypothetical protein
MGVASRRHPGQQRIAAEGPCGTSAQASSLLRSATVAREEAGALSRDADAIEGAIRSVTAVVVKTQSQPKVGDGSACAPGTSRARPGAKAVLDGGDFAACTVGDAAPGRLGMGLSPDREKWPVQPA